MLVSPRAADEELEPKDKPSTMPTILPSLAAFHTIRELQCLGLGRGVYSATDKRATEALYQSASLALEDIHRNTNSVSFRVCSMPTGYGKSNSAIAFMVAAAAHDPEFAAVYVCKERRFAEQTADLIDGLSMQVLGRPLSLVYTTAHADRHDRADKRHFEHHYHGFIPARPLVRKEDLHQARIVVVTHKSWLNEIASGADTGVRFFRGKRRLAFVDEQPDMVNIIEMRPALVQTFHDRMSTASSGTDVCHRLAAIAAAMNAVMQPEGNDYTIPAVVTEGDALLFAPFLVNPHAELSQYVTPGSSPAERTKQIDEMSRVCRYIIAAENMASYYGWRDKIFWAYEPAVKPGAGTVLLDATADLGPIVLFLPGVQRSLSPAPTVDHSNLEVVHVELPKAFWNAKKTVETKRTGEEYGAWMKKVVLALSKPSERVLVVTHKAMLDHEYFPTQRDHNPITLEGRFVFTTHWGTGIGSNEWKDCTTLFEFGEWYQPRGATIGEVHGHKDTPITVKDLKRAVGRKTKDGDYLPKGDYRTAAENHLLRWSAQLAARGNMRNIDGQGRCGRMTLVSTMLHTRLLRNLDRMFPGAPTPRSIVIPITNEPVKVTRTGRDGLIRLLIDTSGPCFTSKEVAKLIGIRPDDLKREFNSERVNVVALAHGWTLANNRRIGKKGKGLNLVKADWLAANENKPKPSAQSA
jgi:hypothetical protein